MAIKISELKIKDRFKGSVITGPSSRIHGEWKVLEKQGNRWRLKLTSSGNELWADTDKIHIEKDEVTKQTSEVKGKLAEKGGRGGDPGKAEEECTATAEVKEVEVKESEEGENGDGNGDAEMEMSDLSKESGLKKFFKQPYLLELYMAGIRNIWMIGPAGCGKTTLARELSIELKTDIHIISCGLGTSSAEFIGYKYPERASTKFADFYGRRSVILLDEFTALDPSVAQIANSALANGLLLTTTGEIIRHEKNLIIATSNTFGQGANRQYVANNQLDASTIDRFMGGILQVGYSKEYEKQYDDEVCEYVWMLRKVIKKNDLRRLASTRMIIEGSKLKEYGIEDWKEFLIVNWNKEEKELINTL